MTPPGDPAKPDHPGPPPDPDAPLEAPGYTYPVRCANCLAEQAVATTVAQFEWTCGSCGTSWYTVLPMAAPEPGALPEENAPVPPEEFPTLTVYEEEV